MDPQTHGFPTLLKVVFVPGITLTDRCLCFKHLNNLIWTRGFLWLLVFADPQKSWEPQAYPFSVSFNTYCAGVDWRNAEVCSADLPYLTCLKPHIRLHFISHVVIGFRVWQDVVFEKLVMGN